MVFLPYDLILTKRANSFDLTNIDLQTLTRDTKYSSQKRIFCPILEVPLFFFNHKLVKSRVSASIDFSSLVSECRRPPYHKLAIAMDRRNRFLLSCQSLYRGWTHALRNICWRCFLCLSCLIRRNKSQIKVDLNRQDRWELP